MVIVEDHSELESCCRDARITDPADVVRASLAVPDRQRHLCP